MSLPHIYQKISEAMATIQDRTPLRPQIGMILGSGLGSIVDDVEDPVFIPYAEIPHFHPATVEGHPGQVIIGKLYGVPCVFLQGRLHVYEGYSMEEIVFPTRTVCGLGIRALLLTNAAGGINTRFRSSDLMLIEDHINLMGDNPLRGPNPANLGPRFPDLSEAYSRLCLSVLESAARQAGIPVHKGVYAGVPGPTYETPAEVRMLRVLGADAVGMSTVPESIAANHLGVLVAGVSSIANLAAGLSPRKLTHEEVIAISRAGAENLKKILTHAIPELAMRTGPQHGKQDHSRNTQE